MRLYIIRDIANQSGITLKDLCKEIGMTYQNLNRCIKDNRMMADDLEKLSITLDVPICIFFDEANNPNCVLRYKDGVVSKSKLAKDNESRDHELEKYRIQLEHMKRELELKDRIIQLLEIR